MSYICQEQDCTSYSTFGIKGERASCCRKHKTAMMVDVKNKLCNEAGCGTRACYGKKDGITEFCAKHKKEGMVNLVSKICKDSGCHILNPAFGEKGGKAEYCVVHKKPNMINIRSKYCEEPNCESISSIYGYKGGKGKFCSTHKKENMIDVTHTYCKHPGCIRVNPLYGLKDGKAEYCNVHKDEHMENLSSKHCKEINCKILYPVFGTKGGKAEYCVIHKKSGMVDVKHKLCNEKGCELRASYSIKGNEAEWCAMHKKENTINTRHTHCQECDTLTRYGIPGQKPTHCNTHKKPGMLRFPTARCRFTACKSTAIYGTNWTPTHCEEHKTEDEKNLAEKPCASCGLLYVLDSSNKCENCAPASFKTARLAKQNALMAYLDARYLAGTSTDIQIEGGVCGKERPDRVYDFGDKIVILECDEHQHRDRQCLCEQTRMINLGQSFGGVPVYFIRWNPDEYLTDKKTESLKKRYTTVGDLIRDLRDHKHTVPNALVSALYLYYDGWNCLKEEKWKILSRLDSYHAFTDE